MRTSVPAGILIGALLAMAQTSGPPPTFEVASVKLMEPSFGTVASRMSSDPGRFDCINCPLITLLAYAYGVRVARISGPSWIGRELYSVSAKIPGGVPRNRIPAMLQRLLAERLRVQVRREMKEEPIYALVVGKDGLKLENAEILPTSGQLPGGSMSLAGDRANGSSVLNFKEATMVTVASGLSNFLDRPVVDMTEIEDAYTFKLAIPTYEMPGMGALRPRSEGEASTPGVDEPSSIFKSIQKLGLRLDARKGPVEYLVVDHAERVPAEN